MLVVRFQEVLSKRVEMIQNLLLIYSYTEIVTPKINQYRSDSQILYEKQRNILEAHKNIFRVDDTLRRLFYGICCNIFVRLSVKARKPMIRINKMTEIYMQFISFFKIINETEIVRHLTLMEVNSMAENQIFYKLAYTLSRFLKAKTDSIINKLNAKCNEERIYEEVKRHQRELLLKENLQKKTVKSRKSSFIFLKKSVSHRQSPQKKYSSQQKQCRKSISQRKNSSTIKQCQSNQLSLFSEPLQSQSRGSSNMDWQIRLKRFQQIFSKQWSKYYSLLRMEELQELKTKCRKFQFSYKKQWINQNFKLLKQDMLNRNSQKIKLYQNYNVKYSEFSPQKNK